MNHGLDWAREETELRGDEYQFSGASTEGVFAVPIDQRKQYLPPGELQNIGEEKSGCVSRAYLNILETKFYYAFQNNLIQSENRNWLIQKEYVTAKGKIEFSDAFIEILSGTTRSGNSLKAPADAIYRYGLIPKRMLPQLDTFDAHHNPQRITEEMRALGEEFKRRWPMNYEQVPLADLEAAVIKDMPALGVYAWPVAVNGEYPKTESPFTHCVMAFALPKTYIFDNYIDSFDGDFIKKLATDYKMTPYGYRIFITKETIAADRDIPAQVFWALSLNGLVSYFLGWWLRFMGGVQRLGRKLRGL